MKNLSGCTRRATPKFLPPALITLAILAGAIGLACGGSDSPSETTAPTETDAESSPLAILDTPWQRELANVSNDGTRSLESALMLFTIAFGPVPGGPAAPEETSHVPSGTIAVMEMYSHWNELTTEQQEAVRVVITPQPGDISAEVLPAATARDPIGKPMAAPAEPAPVLAALTIEQVVEATRATIAQYRPIMAARLGFDLPAKVLVFARAIPRGDAIMTSTPDYINGKANACLVAIYPEALSAFKKPGEEAASAVHELFHCFEFVGSPATKLEEFVKQPEWWREGGAAWAAGNLVGPDPSTNFYSAGWLVYGAHSLFERTYDGLGFFAHLKETGIDPWTVFPAIFKQLTNEPSYLASGADNDRYLESWASSIVREDRGLDWNTTWPGITAEKARLIKVPVLKDTPVSVSSEPYGALTYQLEVDADVLHITVGGYGRFSDGDVDTTSVADLQFCHKTGGCETCPDGSQLKTPPPLLKGTKTLLLALTGGPAGARGTVTGQSLDDVCKRQATPKPNAVAVHYDRQAAQTNENGNIYNLLAGRTMELVSCDGPYGTWKGVMRQGGIYYGDGSVKVPWADFPVEFTVGGDGIQHIKSTSTSFFIVPTELVPYDLDITVTSSRMSIVGKNMSAGEQYAFANPFYDYFTDMPIEPAPAGSCP